MDDWLYAPEQYKKRTKAQLIINHLRKKRGASNYGNTNVGDKLNATFMLLKLSLLKDLYATN
jgi:hypothetical protein